MKVVKHNLFGIFILSVTLVFSQSRTQKSSELFNVASDVVVEINALRSDIIVEFWNKNQVSVETILIVDGVTIDEANKYFDSWNVEALGNSKKVVINSKPDSNHWSSKYHVVDFNFPNIDFDFEPIIAYALNFDSVNFPKPPVMPIILTEHINKIVWNQKEYEKDQEKYLEKFEKEQQEWAEEIEAKLEPMMKDFEKDMEKWEKVFEEKFQPQMKEYEKEMEKWQKDFEKNIEPKLNEHEKHIEKLEKELEPKHEKGMKMKKKITIKIPKGASVDVNIHDSSIKLPKGVKKV